MANIAAIDYDPGASEVNQLNRIKLMLATAGKNAERKAAMAALDDDSDFDPVYAGSACPAEEPGKPARKKRARKKKTKWFSRK